jgi:hypothetical protein
VALVSRLEARRFFVICILIEYLGLPWWFYWYLYGTKIYILRELPLPIMFDPRFLWSLATDLP